MILIGVSQRVAEERDYPERRDALDQRWITFLQKCGIMPLLIPNHLATAQQMLKKFSLKGILLSGGNSLAACGGDAPERDRVEMFLLRYALKHKIPLLGVCRGMQLIQHYYGVPLIKVDGHVHRKQAVCINGKLKVVNSFHRHGAVKTKDELKVWAVAPDGVIEAVRHRAYPLCGIMWHPERFKPFRKEDIRFFKTYFKV